MGNAARCAVGVPAYVISLTAEKKDAAMLRRRGIREGTEIVVYRRAHGGVWIAAGGGLFVLDETSAKDVII